MLEIGSIIDGKYKILNVIGRGGMSVVYLAMNERANKQWAIKEVRKDGVSNYEVVKQGLIAETDMLKKLNHPNLPSIIDVIDGEGKFLIVMDYIEGKSLNEILRYHGAQSQDDVIEWTKQLCDVLGYLHSREKPIIYRDMKPSNVMLKPDGNVMLIDFGTAREFKSKCVEDTTCLGTQGYAAPEQFGGMGQTDARTDIYCLGATMYHLVTGHNPAEPPYEMYPIRQWNPKLSSGLEEIILKCTQKNPSDRYQSCVELMYDLEHYKDLELESKKSYNRKWRMFIGSLVMCGLCLVGTIGVKFASNAKIKDTYETYVESAKNNINGQKYKYAIDDYIKAIETDSSNPDPYFGIINIYRDGLKFDKEASTTIAQEFTESRMKELKAKHKNEYYELMRIIGRSYFYLYEDEELRYGYAGEYLGIAEESGSTLNKEELMEIEAISYICANVDKIGSKTRGDGTSVMDYKAYYENLVRLVDADYDLDANRVAARTIYKRFCCDVLKNNVLFKIAGVSTDNMLSKATKICDKLDEIVEREKENQILNIDTEDLEIEIDDYRDSINEMRKKKNQNEDDTNSDTEIDENN